MTLNPKALRPGDDAWELVVEKLVRVGPNYYKARRQCVRGEADILQTLHRLNQPDLFEDAKRAMEGPPRSYRITEGSLEASDPELDTRSESSTDVVRQLVRQCARLEGRVEALENAIRASRRRSSSSPPATRAKSDSRAGMPDSSSSSARPQTRDEDQRGSPVAGASTSPKAPGDADEALETEPTKPTEPTEPTESTESTEPTEPRLKFPDASILSRAYADLIGDEVVLRDLPSFSLDEGVSYAADFLDEDEDVVGALALDLRAAVFQAGALAMLDEDARQAMFEGGEPSADILDALNELINAQSLCINNVPGNPHTHAGPVRRVDPDVDPWAFPPSHTMALGDPFDGRMLLVSR